MPKTKAFGLWRCTLASTICLRLRAAAFARTRANLDVGARDGHRLVFLLDPELHAIVAGGLEHLRRGEVPLDLALARLVRIAVDSLFRGGAISPFPLNRWAVEILVIVRAALQIGGDDDASGGERDNRRRFDGDARFPPLGSARGDRQQ